MRKMPMLVVLFALLSALPLFANGTAEKEGQQATGLENWQTDIQLSPKQSGKYNILITGSDRAGNVSYAGPINVIVDPKSDLPVVSISNPLPLMRVGGDLNIVGTCIDDDAVGKVEVSIDGADFVQAEGTEFWSYYLDGKTLPDGRHTIVVRGVDNKGTVGDPKKVQFDLDRNKPVSQIESQAAGVLVSGKIKLQGGAEDANGIKQVWASLDEGKTFRPVDTSFSKAKQEWLFSLSLDTTKYKDGPFVIWFKSKDGCGSIGYSPFLLFIVNTKPVVKLVYPPTGTAVNGKFQLAWTATDLIGLKSLAWKFAGQSGSCDPKPGNPYYAAEVTAPAAKPKDSSPLTIVATDIAGNVTTYTAPIAIDNAADLPLVSLTSPVNGQAVEGDFAISGGARDDDGVATIRWKIDGGAAQDLAATGSFRIPVTGLANGKHSLSVWAVDVNGKEGPVSAVAFLQNGTAPSIAFKSIATGAGGKTPSSLPFLAGSEISPDSGSRIEGAISCPAKIASATWEMSGGLTGVIPVTKASGEVPFSIAVPATGPYGIVDITIKATDEFKRDAVSTSFIYVSDFSRVRREPQFDFSDSRVQANGTVALGSSRPFQLAFVGEDVASAELVPPSDVISLQRDGNVISLSAAKEGSSKPVAVKVTTVAKHVFTSSPWTFVTDDRPPVIKIDSAPGSAPQTKAFDIKGSASDGVGVDSLSWRVLPAGDKKPVTLKAGSFDLQPSFSDLPEGAFAIELEAADAAGNKSHALVPLVKDTVPPSLQSLTPVDGSADVQLTVAGIASDPSGIAKVEFAPDGAVYTLLSNEAVFTHAFDPVQSPKASYRVTDKAGNVGVYAAPHFASPLPMPPAAKGPSVLILSPQAGAAAGKEAVLAVRVESAQPLSSVSWTLDTLKGSFDPSTGPVWVARIPLDSVKSKAAVIRVQAADSAKGSGAAQVSVNVNPSLGAPSVTIQAPADGAAPDAQPELVASASSASGIASMAYSIDGADWTSAPSAGALATVLSGLSAGMHSVSVKAIGGDGLESAPVKRSFKVAGPSSTASFSFTSGKDAPVPYVPGMTLVINGTSLGGTVSSPNGFASGVLALDDGTDLKAAFKKVSATDTAFTALLPTSLAFDRVGFKLTVTDALGLQSVCSGVFYRVAPPAQSRVDPGIYAVADSIRTDGGKTSVQLGSDPLSLRFVGRPIAKVALSPDPKGIVSLTSDGRMLSLVPGTEGISAPTTMSVVTVDGDSYSFGPFTAVVDKAPPAIDLQSPAEDAWLKGKIPLTAKITDANGIDSAAWSLDGTTWTPLKVGSDGTVSDSLDAGSLPDGAFILTVKATDRAGKSSAFSRAINKDTAAPLGAVVMPAEGDSANGSITLAGVFSDPAGSLSSLDFSTDGKTWDPSASLGYLTRDVELSKVGNDPSKILFRARDKSGNETIASPKIKVDGEADLPVVYLQLPEEEEVQRADFVISGVVTDDDGVKDVVYRLDGGSEVTLPLNGYSFSIPMKLSDVADNEHTVEIYAHDIYGVQGKTVLRHYRVSKAEPTALMMSPPLESTIKGVIQLEGTASDANGIQGVAVSVDNALSFDRADLAESKVNPENADWKYRLDTRSLPDGLHSIYVKPVDKYDTEGFFATLINVDNTDPTVTLDQPQDGSQVSGNLQISGRVFDNVALAQVTLDFTKITTIDGKPVTAPPDARNSLSIDLGVASIITRPIDISGLDEGVYNLRIRAADKADNYALATRTVTVLRKRRTESVDLMFPLKGETVAGEFSINAMARTEKPVSTALVFVDGAQAGSATVDENGYFSYKVKPADLADGPHSLSARVVNAAGDTISSAEIPISYSRSGAWITVDNFPFGTYLPERPYLKGHAGWFDADADSRTKAEKAALAKAHTVTAIDISMDNGKTFLPADGTSSWKFRLETQDYPEGEQFLIIRATYADGTKSLAKTILNLDKTPPKISLLSPIENTRLNEKISLIGTASDETALGEIRAILRKGDKSGYEVPSFIQGLFFEGHFLGATYWDAGMGLTFFGDNVKLMGTYGQGPLGERYGGQTIGAKLLANITYIPFSYFLGPDWKFLSANLAVGAGFSYFTDTQNNKGQILGSVLAQLEFPVFTLPGLKAFRKYSFYTEYSAWFVASEVSGAIMQHIAFGGRVSVF